MIFFFEKYTESIRKLQDTMTWLGVDIKIVVLEEDSFGHDGILFPYEFYIFKQNWEKCELSEANVVCKEWRMESGWLYKIDFCNQAGVRRVSKFLDQDGNVESKVFYSNQNQEVLVEQPGNDVFTIIKENAVQKIFLSRFEFIRSFMREAFREEKYAIFVETEEQLKYLNMESEQKDIWEHVFFTGNDLLKRYRDENGKNGIRFYAPQKYYPENMVNGEALILTASDKIEKLEELVQELPHIVFHIAAHTQVSDKLYKLAECENVKVYPGISERDLGELWNNCAFYLDINHYREIDDAVNVASQKNLLILGFEDTLHQRELVVKGCIFSAQDYRKMALVIKRLQKDEQLMQKVLLTQQKKRIKVWRAFLEDCQSC